MYTPVSQQGFSWGGNYVMGPLNYVVSFYVACDDEPKPKLVGVCNYDVYVNKPHLISIHQDVIDAVNCDAGMFNIVQAVHDEERFACEFFYVAMDPKQIAAEADPADSLLSALLKASNSYINRSMRNIHQVVYPLSRPVGC
jgi:hypothetical protein